MSDHFNFHAINNRLDDHHRHLLKLLTIVENIMSAISDFATANKAFTDRQDAAVTAIQAEVKALNDKISALQNSPGAITAEDQALLDAIQAHSKTLADNLEAFKAAQPPVPPAA